MRDRLLGIFLHFQDDPLLSRTVILQNNWATDAVFKIFDDEPVKAQRGYFNRGSCARIWANSIYADMHLELLTLMVKFELCYQLPDQQNDTWLTPQLLTPSVPEVFRDWDEADDLVLTYQYDFLPKGLVNRLMVRMHRFVRDPSYSWESGAFFEKESTILLARISINCGQEIELRARGSDPKSLMSIISSDLDALNGSFQGLRDKVRKLVPCRCDQCMSLTTPFRFDEPTLLRAKHQNILSLRCNYSFQEVNVSRLLDGLDFTPPRIQIGTKVLNRFDNLYEARNLNHSVLDANTKLIRVFLASSSELKEDRDSFELYFRQENDRLRRKGFYLEITRWENFLDAMSETRLQDDYNKKIENCDIFVSLFKTKTGKYTEEEFDTAHASFKATGKPLIYTYFMRTEVPNDRRLRGALISLWDFQDRLSDLGHFHTEYISIHDLQNKFKRQLDKIIDEKLMGTLKNQN